MSKIDPLTPDRFADAKRHHLIQYTIKLQLRCHKGVKKSTPAL